MKTIILLLSAELTIIKVKVIVHQGKVYITNLDLLSHNPLISSDRQDT